MNAKISETIRATILGLGMQIPEIPAQRKFVSAMCHAHSNAHKPPKTVATTVLNADISETIKDRKMGSQIYANMPRPF